MSLKKFPELHSFLSAFFDTDPDVDEETARTFVTTLQSERRNQILDQLRVQMGKVDLEELGTETNRWFGEPEEARLWLQKLQSVLESTHSNKASVTKDSNGTPLNEGDSVMVIKDLKVKGGSSDLKRGTAIKKIHLIDDPEAIECRVDGSTLVLKTCFLKKT